MMADAEYGPDAGSRARVFISYSRKDMPFADRLDAALKVRGFEPLIDRTAISDLEDWRHRIGALITQADDIVFVLSPDSVRSAECKKEIEFAASLNKRFAPVLCRKIDDAEVPETLARINRINFIDAPFDATVDRLVKALETDIAWVRKHTEFGALAQRWAEAARPGPRGLLVRSPTLEEAERWIATRPQGAPQPTAVVYAFIAESRQAATRRRNLLTATLGTGLVLALALSGLAYWQRGIAVQNEMLASLQRDRALLTQSRFLADLANQRINAGNAGAGILLTLEALPDERSGVTRPYASEAEVALFKALQQLREIALLKGHEDSVNNAAFSPDGKRIVTASDDKTVRIWDATTGKELIVLKGHDDPVSSATFSPDGALVVTAAGRPHTLVTDPRTVKDYTARIWDAANGKELIVLRGHKGWVKSAAFSPDSKRIVTASDDKTVRIWNATSGKELVVLSVEEGVNSATFSPDGSRVAAASEDGTAHIWDATSGKDLIVLSGHEGGVYGEVYSAAFSPDGTRVVTASRDTTARIWDATTGKELIVLRGHESWVLSAAFSLDGKRIVTTSRDTTARIWDAETGKETAVLKAHEGWVKSAAFSPDGNHVVTASGFHFMFKDSPFNLKDYTARVWDASSNARGPVVLRGHENHVMNVAFSPDGARVATGSDDKTARIWDAANGKELVVLRGHEGGVYSAVFSPDGARVLTTSWDNTARIWEASNGKELVIFKFRGIEAAFSPDGARVVAASWDKMARILDAANGKELVVLTGHEGGVKSAAFSPDGKRIVTASDDKTARVWDATAGKELLVLRGHEEPVNIAAFSPDGSLVVTASGGGLGEEREGTARIWDATSGTEIAVLKHQGPVHYAAFSPDGTRVVTAAGTQVGKGSAAYIWDAGNGKEIATFKRHMLAVLRAVFSPNGARVVTADALTARLWDADTGKEIGLFKMNGSSRSVAFSPDGTHVLTAPPDMTVRIWRLFPTTQSLVDDSKQLVLRCLSRVEREQAFLDPVPPAWCIEMEKWPYDNQAWKDWLRFSRAGLSPPLPDLPDWQAWLAARQTESAALRPNPK
jgi:WD40 repeat protein